MVCARACSKPCANSVRSEVYSRGALSSQRRMFGTDVAMYCRRSLLTLSFQVRQRSVCPRAKRQALSRVWQRMPLHCGSTNTRLMLRFWPSYASTELRRVCARRKKWFVRRLLRVHSYRANLPIVRSKTLRAVSCFSLRATPPVARQSRRVIARSKRSSRCAGKF